MYDNTTDAEFAGIVAPAALDEIEALAANLNALVRRTLLAHGKIPKRTDLAEEYENISLEQVHDTLIDLRDVVEILALLLPDDAAVTSPLDDGGEDDGRIYDAWRVVAELAQIPLTQLRLSGRDDEADAAEQAARADAARAARDAAEDA